MSEQIDNSIFLLLYDDVKKYKYKRENILMVGFAVCANQMLQLNLAFLI